MPTLIPPVYFANLAFSGVSSVPAIAYDTSTHAWTITPTAANVLSIVSDADETGLLLNGRYCLFVRANGAVRVGGITTRVTRAEYPRLDFFRQADSVPRRFASLSQDGTLSVMQASEKASIPGGSIDRMYLLNANASIGLDGLLAPSGITEIGLRYSGFGPTYLTDKSGLPLSRK